ncbi:MAG: NlpC/P60 family protein [Syntrophomonadaceae bacterium]
MRRNLSMKNRIIAYLLILTFMVGNGVVSTAPAQAATSTSSKVNSAAIISSLRTNHNDSLASAIVGRAIWYMEYGYIKYGHTKYATTGYCDCSQFLSMVYKDYGYSITSASRKYDTVGVPVEGVYVKNGKLVGVEKLKPGDIFTFQRVDHITHVAMFIGMYGGKPCFIGTTSGYPTAIGIVSGFNNWYGDQFHGVRRVFTDKAYVPGGKITDRGPVIPAVYRIKPTQPVVMPKNLPTGF